MHRLRRGFEGSSVLDTSRSCRDGNVAITISASPATPNYGRYIEDIVGPPETGASSLPHLRTSRTSPPDKNHSSKIATALVHPALAPRILCGKQEIVNPSGGSASRLCSFSMWQ
jgi:hypothetical protein